MIVIDVLDGGLWMGVMEGVILDLIALHIELMLID